MQVQLNHITGSEGVLWQIREKQFVDHAFSCDAHRAFLFARRMRCDDHAEGCLIRFYRDRGTIVEAAHHLAFGALLKLIRGQVQARPDERTIEQAVVFAARHKRKARCIGEYRPIAILPVEA